MIFTKVNEVPGQYCWTMKGIILYCVLKWLNQFVENDLPCMQLDKIYIECAKGVVVLVFIDSIKLYFCHYFSFAYIFQLLIEYHRST
jgi:hypothetical protein